jgi:ADP-ribose pyrophosphatase YjhB (NUDIX family)
MGGEEPRFYYANNHHYRYCPHCATPLDSVLEGLRPRPTCPSCGFVQYLNPPLAATILLTRGDRVLMARRTIEPRCGYWTLPGGYVELGESAEEAAVREAKEEVGVDVRVERLLGLHSGAPSAVAVALFVGNIVGVDELPALAFWSTHWALDLWAAERRQARPHDHAARRAR